MDEDTPPEDSEDLWNKTKNGVRNEWERLQELSKAARGSYVVIIILAVVVGLLIAPFASSVIGVSQGKVAVIPVAGTTDSTTASEVSSMLARARGDPSIKAVVLTVNSGGGPASSSETLYLQVKRASKQMPVVTSVDSMAASGAYYTSVPSDFIYAKPSSLVGSVGVFATLPAELDPIDSVVTTGPNKLTGDTRRGWTYMIESLRRAFVGAVMENRGDKLTISAERVSFARIYTGAQAVRNGMADDIGGTEDAIRKAASLAGLDSYRVVFMQPDSVSLFLYRSNYINSNVPKKKMVRPSYYTGVSGEDNTTLPNVLMLPPEVLQDTRPPEVSRNDRSITKNTTQDQEKEEGVIHNGTQR